MKALGRLAPAYAVRLHLHALRKEYVSGFSEHGSLVPLDIHSNSQDSLRTDVGAQAYYNWHLGKISVIPGLKLAWEHEYRYSNLDITGSAPALKMRARPSTDPTLAMIA